MTEAKLRIGFRCVKRECEKERKNNARGDIAITVGKPIANSLGVTKAHPRANYTHNVTRGYPHEAHQHFHTGGSGFDRWVHGQRRQRADRTERSVTAVTAHPFAVDDC